ncbi:hypothetical protein E4U32_001174 [Claviceps aff. humidiphila group G2b]|nr:hypothetical protein E4U32_001174 [Claviceps aff. humidiphila group G2b]
MTHSPTQESRAYLPNVICGRESALKAMGLSSTATDLKLSAGEMQLFCLARTLLHAGSNSNESGVLILDEATSSLDRET